jgi:hypothetical protein
VGVLHLLLERGPGGGLHGFFKTPLDHTIFPEGSEAILDDSASLSGRDVAGAEGEAGVEGGGGDGLVERPGRPAALLPGEGGAEGLMVAGMGLEEGVEGRLLIEVDHLEDDGRLARHEGGEDEGLEAMVVGVIVLLPEEDEVGLGGALEEFLEGEGAAGAGIPEATDEGAVGVEARGPGGSGGGRGGRGGGGRGRGGRGDGGGGVGRGRGGAASEEGEGEERKAHGWVGSERRGGR